MFICFCILAIFCLASLSACCTILAGSAFFATWICIVWHDLICCSNWLINKMVVAASGLRIGSIYGDFSPQRYSISHSLSVMLWILSSPRSWDMSRESISPLIALPWGRHVVSNHWEKCIEAVVIFPSLAASTGDQLQDIASVLSVDPNSLRLEPGSSTWSMNWKNSINPTI